MEDLEKVEGVKATQIAKYIKLLKAFRLVEQATDIRIIKPPGTTGRYKKIYRKLV
jgi:hypothetical protein